MKLSRYFKALMASVRMFSILPVPNVEWEENGGGRMIAWLGVVGLLLGALQYGAFRLLSLTGMNLMLEAFLLTLLTHALTGFLHLDGFMDVCDAVLSRRDAEERRRILKDPHTGSFAVICVAFEILLRFVCVYILLEKNADFRPIFLIPALVRALSGIMVVRMEAMPGSALAAYFKKGAGDGTSAFLLICAVLSLAGLVLLGGLRQSAALLIGCAVGLLIGYSACRPLGGINGDVAGASIVFAEVLSLLSLAIYL